METLELIAKRMHQSGQHIEKFKVKLFAPNLKLLKPEYVMSRMDLLLRAKAGTNLCTRTTTGGFTDVHIIIVDGVEYFRTDHNKIATDNLGHLPDF